MGMFNSVTKYYVCVTLWYAHRVKCTQVTLGISMLKNTRILRWKHMLLAISMLNNIFPSRMDLHKGPQPNKLKIWAVIGWHSQKWIPRFYIGLWVQDMKNQSGIKVALVWHHFFCWMSAASHSKELFTTRKNKSSSLGPILRYESVGCFGLQVSWT